MDKAEAPGHKPCAAGLTERSLRLLGSDEADVVHRAVTRADILLGDRLIVSVSAAGPLVATTTRREFDAMLIRSALAAGATIDFGTAVNGVTRRGEQVGVDCGDRELRCRCVVFADGARGRGRGILELAPLRHSGAAYVRAFPGSQAEMDRFADRVTFDLTASRRGYGWVFPKRDHVNVGVFSQRPLSKELLDDLRRFLDGLGLVGWRTEGPLAFPVPQRTGRESWGRGSCLLAGDAAALVDPISGEGISMAMASGRVAAESVAESLDSGGELLSIYGSRIAAEVVPMAEAMRRKGELIYSLGPRVLRSVARVPPLRSMAERALRSTESVRDGSMSFTVRQG
jgi:geranylgeranyl reductase family protein